MHDVDVFEPGSGDSEHWVRETATYGVDVKHRDFKFPASDVTGWKALGDIEKLTSDKRFMDGLRSVAIGLGAFFDEVYPEKTETNR